jgi:hypothetical protein
MKKKKNKVLDKKDSKSYRLKYFDILIYGYNKKVGVENLRNYYYTSRIPLVGPGKVNPIV